MFRHSKLRSMLSVVLAAVLMLCGPASVTASHSIDNTYSTQATAPDPSINIDASDQSGGPRPGTVVRAAMTWNELQAAYPNALRDTYPVPVPTISWSAFIEPILEDDCTAEVFASSGEPVAQSALTSIVVMVGQHFAVYESDSPVPILLMDIVDSSTSGVSATPTQRPGTEQAIAVNGPAASQFTTGNTVSFRVSCPGYTGASASVSAEGLQFLRVEQSANAVCSQTSLSLSSGSASATYYYKVTAQSPDLAVLTLKSCSVSTESGSRSVPDISTGAHAAASYPCFVITADRSTPYRITTGSTVRISVTASSNRFEAASGSIRTKGLAFTRIEHSIDSLSDQDNLVLLPSNSSMSATVMYSYTVTAQPGETLSLSVVDAAVSFDGYDMAVPDTVWSARASAPLSTPSPVSTSTPTSTVTPTPSPSPTASPSHTLSPTAAPTPSASPSASGALIAAKPGSDLSVWDTSFGLVVTGLKIGTRTEFTSVGDVLSKLIIPQNASAVVTDKDGSVRSNNSPIATGDIITVTDASGRSESATAVVRGDLTGTGLISLTQVVTIARAFRGDLQLTGPYLLAGDITATGSISLTDVVQEAKMFVSSQRTRSS